MENTDEELKVTSECYSEKAMAPHSSTLAWKVPWMEEPGRLQSMGLLSRTWLSDFTFTFCFHALEKEMATHSSVLAWRIPGTGELGGLPSMGSHRVGHDWSDLAIAIAMNAVIVAEVPWSYLQKVSVSFYIAFGFVFHDILWRHWIILFAGEHRGEKWEQNW